MSKKYKTLSYFYGEHSSGTKFYELYLLQAPGENPILIRRYGKMAVQSVGGASMIETGSSHYEFNKLRSAKTRTSASGHYNDLSRPAGRIGTLSPDLGVEHDVDQIVRHYRSTSGIDVIRHKLGLVGTEEYADATFADPSKPFAKPPKPVPQVEGWGAW